MSIFDDGNIECVKNLLRPAERVLKQGRDILVEEFSRRERLWHDVKSAYDKYLDGSCGYFLKDLDTNFRAKFEAALAILAWSFESNGENFYPARRRFTKEELQVVDEILKYNIFEIMTKDDILTKLYRRDSEVLELLKTYYIGVDKWIEEQLNNPDIKLPLRYYFKKTWGKYKEKLNEAISEANKYDWFRTLLEDWEKEKKESVEAVKSVYERKVQELRQHIKEITEAFEYEKERIVQEISRASMEEIERLEREKQELIERFEKEKEKLTKQLIELKDKELQEKLQAELERARESMMKEVKRLEEEIQRRSVQLKQKEMELKRKEMELMEKDQELRRKINEILKASENLEKGSRLVIREEARIQELNFLGRLKSKLKDKVKLLGKTYKVEEISEKLGEDTSKFASTLDEKTLKNLPENRYLEVKLKEKKLLGGKEKLLLKGHYITRVEKLAEYGFDTDPLELADVNAYLVDARDSSKNERTILLIASPLGFEERIKKYVNSDQFHQNFYSENVSLLLLDVETGEVIYNPNDRYAKALVPLVRMELDEEVYAKVKECIKSKLIGRDYLPFSEVKDCGNEAYVKKAFYEVAKEENGFVKYIDGFGLVLMKGVRR
ncbi:hypothetical protein E3E31_08145 [Thermococcus sp. M39]|uniref:hypothetical protein n=1 Tax=Thermococcus sp. M39 TaxID=1638262 RepID=UPI0014394D3B|nr:hypothetical protein [Thermococcus sp. M39]NJE08491.1 hypothetical protein [Thermococcus sp. M39]